MMKRVILRTRCMLILIAGLFVAAPVFADYTASGKFLYEDREFGMDGFTRNIIQRPIRYADVHIMAGAVLLAKGATDQDGTFSIRVPGSAAQTITAICITSSEATPDLLLDARVANDDFSFGDFYSVSSAPTAASGALPVDLGATLALASEDTGKIFNIWDVVVDCMQFVASPQAAGSLPSSRLTVIWRYTHPRGGSFFETEDENYIYVGSSAAYDDTVIAHEFGHFIDLTYSKSDSPAGSHVVGDNKQDIRLSWGEGLATFLGSTIRRFKGYPNPEIYVSTDGEILSFSLEIESLTGSLTVNSKTGSTNEIAVSATLWDITDGVDTDDATPGEDDDPLQRPFTDVWRVLSLYMPTVTRPGLSIETFWNGWFSPEVGNGELSGMQAVFATVNGIEFVEDAYEPDNSAAVPPFIVPVRIPSLALGTRVVINELEMGRFDALELYNAGDTPADLTGWSVAASAPGFDTAVLVIPKFVLEPGAFVILSESVGIDTKTTLYFSNNISWNNGDPGACALRDSKGSAIDFVRWGGSKEPVPAGTIFIGPDPPAPPPGKTLGRDIIGTDSNSGRDWTALVPAMGTYNISGKEDHHTFYAVGDVDYAGFNASPDKHYLVETLDLESGADTLIEVIGKDGITVLVSNDDFGTTRASRVSWTPSTSGRYFIRARRYDAPTNFAQYGSYDLRVIESGTPLGLALPTVLAVSAGGQGGKYQRLSDALSAASNGDTVQIMDSATYAENVTISGKSITLKAAEGGSPVLDGGNAAALATLTILNAKTFRIEGLQIIGGSPGVRFSGGNMTVVNTVISKASGSAGPADGIQISGEGSHASLVNCTIVNNGRSGIEIIAAGSAKVVNSIVWGNGVADINRDPAKATLQVRNSLLGGGFAGTNGNIQGDPQFVNAEAQNFRLKSTSPAIDLGDATEPDLPARDADDAPRIIDGSGDGVAIPDMGAYEYLPLEFYSALAAVPQIAVGGIDPVYRTTIVGVNVGQASATVQVTLADSDANPFPANVLTGPIASSSRPGAQTAPSAPLNAASGSFLVSIPPSGIARIETSGAGNTISGYARFLSSRRLGGSALIKSVMGNSVRSEAGVGFSDPGKQFTVYIDNQNYARSGYALVNLGNADAHITMTLRDREGITLETKTVTPPLGPGRHFAEFAIERFGAAAPDGFEGSIEFVSDQDVAAVALRYDNPGGTAFSTIPVLQADTSTILYFPQIADGGGYRGNIIIVNPSDIDTVAKLEFFDDEGSPLNLPIGGTLRASYEMTVRHKGVARLLTDGTSPQIEAGWVRATAGVPIGGSSIFQTLEGTGIQSEAGVSSSPPSTRIMIYVDSWGDTQSGVALCNPNPDSVEITLKLRDSSGYEVASKDLSLPPLGHVARFFTQWFPEGFEEFEGNLEILASDPVSGVALRYDNYEADVFATLPVIEIR